VFTRHGPPSPEVTEVFCRVPSPQLSRSPQYSLPDHLCRFGVRAVHQLTRGFSRQHRITEFTSIGYASPLRLYAVRICLHNALQAYTRYSITRPSYLPASPHRLTTTIRIPCSHIRLPEGSPSAFGRLAQLIHHLARIHGYGNINPLSIDYACRPRLRSRLTLGGLTWPRNPWSFGGRVSHSSFATHACILTPIASTTSSHCCFPGYRTLPYPATPLPITGDVLCDCRGFGGVLEPRYIIGAGSLDQ
jgi:hypothetical protein